MLLLARLARGKSIEIVLFFDLTSQPAYGWRQIL